MDAVDGDPLREPQVSLPSITGTTQITTLSMWQYIPSTVTTAYGFYDTIGGNGLIFETGYIAPTGGRWTQQNTWGPATGDPPLNTYGSNPQITIVPDQWQQIQYVFDPNNGISEYYGLPGSMTLAASISVADINSATAFLNSEAPRSCLALPHQWLWLVFAIGGPRSQHPSDIGPDLLGRYAAYGRQYRRLVRQFRPLRARRRQPAEPI